MRVLFHCVHCRIGITSRKTHRGIFEAPDSIALRQKKFVIDVL